MFSFYRFLKTAHDLKLRGGVYDYRKFNSIKMSRTYVRTAVLPKHARVAAGSKIVNTRVPSHATRKGGRDTPLPT